MTLVIKMGAGPRLMVYDCFGCLMVDVMDKWRQWFVTAFMSVGLLFSGCRGFFAIEDSGRLER